MRTANPLCWTDAYKLDHRRQYPHRTTVVLDNWTGRGSRIKGLDFYVHFSLQAFIIKMVQAFNDGFFSHYEDDVAAEYEAFTLAVLGPNEIGSDHIRALHRLGYLPLVFRSLPEGTFVPIRVPSVTIENTLDEFFWLPNYIETMFSTEVWQPTTTATQAAWLRLLLDKWAHKAGDPAFTQWQGHDFSFRGMAGVEAAAKSGAGHLLSFTGTDTLVALPWIEENYGPTRGFVGGSVAATEHSVMCAGGELGERETFERLLDLYPTGIVSVVSDTWDLWHVLTDIVPSLKDKILARDGKLVIRPDSGDPVDILCGTVRAADRVPGESYTPDEKGVIELLWDTFGGTTNDKGYKVLDSHVGTIYGDSITYDRADAISARLVAKGFSPVEVLGIGSFTYQCVTRDTLGFAMKATWAEVDGVGRDLFKNPVTDNGLKRSAKGRVAVLRGVDGVLRLYDCATEEQEARSLLVPVWADGFWAPGGYQTFDEIRARVEAELDARRDFD